MSLSPRLSIVVPFYNVERYIAECLDSLQEQSLADFEAILVDDGSEDASLTIAEKYAADDPRFRIVRQENQGLGPARNTGIRHATGEYLTFVDSDDVVPPRAYEQMVSTLDRTGSDMASGDARRFNDLGVRESWVHRIPFATERLRTHVRRYKPLALDRMAWNKVYRRTFWDEQGFRFPAGLYEDYPVTIRSHVLARQVDALATPVYYWRERDGGDLSITQRVWQVANLRDRVVSDEKVLDFLEEAAPELLTEVGRHFLQIDVSAVVGALHRNDPADHPEVLALAQRLLRRITDEAIRTSGPYERVQSHLIRTGRLRELEQLVDRRARVGTGGPVVRRGRLRPRYYRELPFFEDAAVGVPAELYRVGEGALRLDGTVVDAWWESDAVVVEARVGIGNISLAGAPPVKAWLRSPSGRARPLTVEESPTERPDRRALRLRLDTAGIAAEPGHWALEVELSAEGRRTRGPLHATEAGRARWSEQRELAPGVWAKPTLRSGAYGLWCRRPGVLVTGLTADGDELVATGWFTPGPEGRPPAVWFRLLDGSDTVAAGTEPPMPHVLPPQPPAEPVEPVPSGKLPFEARLDARELASHGAHDHITERSAWIARVAVGGAPPGSLLLPTRVGSAAVLVGSRRVTLVADPAGHLCAHEEYAHPTATAVTPIDGGLRISGRFDRDAPLPRTARLRRYVTPADPVVLELPLQWSERSFTLEVPVAELAALADGVDHEDEGRAPTAWDVLLLDPQSDAAEPVVADVATAHLLPGVQQLAGREVRIRLGRMARLGLVVADG